MSFPKWVFNKAGDKKLVQSPEDLKALGSGWADSAAEAAEGKAAGKDDAEDAKEAAKEKEAAEAKAKEATESKAPPSNPPKK